jgi:hypothetical protein
MDWSTLLPVATLILGAGLTMLTERLRDGRQLAREQSVRDAARQTEKLDRKDEFELRVLRETHSAITELMRALLKIHLEGSDRHHRGGPYLPEGDSGRDQYERLRQKQGEFSSLKGLILEDSIRYECDKFQGLVTQVSIATSYEDADTLLTRLGPVLAKVQDSISARIRTLYKEPTRRQ